MSFADSDNDLNYDSDIVDEELETQLYGAVFFDTHLSNFDQGDVSINSPGNATKGSPFSEKNVSTLNAASAVTISPFQDDASVESDEFSIRNSPKDEGDDQTMSLTSCSSPTSDSQSSHNGLPCFTLDSSDSVDEVSQSTEDWSAGDVVIGVSKHSKSMICNADDCVAIARRLAQSRSDPNLWQVTGADRFSTPQTKRAARYFDDSFCANCRQKGHLTSSCQRSGPVCIFCGEEGHERDSCPNVYCYICFSFGHSKAKCPLENKLRQSVCNRCGQQGHNSKLCTEIWRQYISTTEEGKPVPTPKRLKVAPRGCCNCGRKNHVAEDCLRKMFRSNIPGPLPHRRVHVYDKKDIYTRLRRVMEKKASKKAGNSKKKAKTAATNPKKKSSVNSKKRENCTLVDDEAVSLVREKERVEQQLFNCFSSRLQSPQDDATASPSADTKKTPERGDAPTRLPPNRPLRRESADGAAFLPLAGTPQGRRSGPLVGRKRPFAHSRKPFTNDSPFSWINRSTSFNEINDQPRGYYSNANPVRLGKAYASTSSFSYNDRWRQASWRRNESPQRMKASKTCPSLLSLECDSLYNSRRSRKQQQQQWKKKRIREAGPPIAAFDRDKRAKKKNTSSRPVFPVDQFSSRQDGPVPGGCREVTPRKRRSETPNSIPKSKRTDWMAFVNRSVDVDPWD